MAKSTESYYVAAENREHLVACNGTDHLRRDLDRIFGVGESYSLPKSTTDDTFPGGPETFGLMTVSATSRSIVT